MRFAFAAAAALTLAWPGPAGGETAADAGAAAVREAAIAVWLDDDEAGGLAGLAAAARAGDVPAALLLTALEMREPESPYRAGLSPDARRDLFRAPGSAFGTPWVDALPAGAAPDLARALKALRARDDPAALTAALEAGDIALARQAALRLAARDPARLMAFDRTAPLPAELRPLLWLTAADLARRGVGGPDIDRLLEEMTAVPDGLGLRVAALAAVAEEEGTAPQDLALGSLLRTGRPMPPPDFATLTEAAALIAEAPEGRTLAALCRASCRQDVTGCLVAGNAALRGWLGLFALDTPLAAVIPSDRFRDSARARSELLRLAMGSGALRSMLPDTPGGACLGALIPAQ